jgi:serine/threonine-protein kinase RsbT
MPAAVASPVSTVVHIASAADIANALDAGRDIARRVGFTSLEQMKIATAISELARNILLYASTGEVFISGALASRHGIEVRATDRGPGILDVPLVMSSAFRSRTGMGMGLKGVQRLMDDFSIDSVPGQGTTVVVRKYTP